MPFCNRCWKAYGADNRHLADPIHLRSIRCGCPICGQDFVSHGARGRHYGSSPCNRPSDGRCKCRQCGQEFTSVASFDQHVRRGHGPGQILGGVSYTDNSLATDLVPDYPDSVGASGPGIAGDDTHAPPIYTFNPRASVYIPVSGTSAPTPTESVIPTAQSKDTPDSSSDDDSSSDSSDSDSSEDSDGGDEGDEERNLPTEGTGSDNGISLNPDPTHHPTALPGDNWNVPTSSNSGKKTQTKGQKESKKKKKGRKRFMRFFPARLFDQYRRGLIEVREAAQSTSRHKGKKRIKREGRYCPLCVDFYKTEYELKRHLRSPVHEKDMVKEGRWVDMHRKKKRKKGKKKGKKEGKKEAPKAPPKAPPSAPTVASIPRGGSVTDRWETTETPHPAPHPTNIPRGGNMMETPQRTKHTKAVHRAHSIDDLAEGIGSFELGECRGGGFGLFTGGAFGSFTGGAFGNGGSGRGGC